MKKKEMVVGLILNTIVFVGVLTPLIVGIIKGVEHNEYSYDVIMTTHSIMLIFSFFLIVLNLITYYFSSKKSQENIFTLLVFLFLFLNIYIFNNFMNITLNIFMYALINALIFRQFYLFFERNTRI